MTQMLTRSASPTSIFKGALLTVSMRWTGRLIGVVSTLVLARLIAPDDFGIIAMSSLVLGIVDVLFALGVNVALIQNSNATKAHYDTAWTMRLAQSILAMAVVFFSATYAARYFNDPRIAPVLQCMSLCMLLQGLENIGVITFQKEMRFGLDFRFVFLKRLTGFLVTVVSAWLLQSYWALVIGSIGGRCFGVLLSYHMHPMRPRISIEKIGDIFSISHWMLINSIGGYLNRSIDKVLIGNRASANVIGGYALADEISAMPSTEVLAPLNRVLFPAFVAAKHDRTELKRLYLLAQSVQCMLGIPAGVGLALVAQEAVFVLLGEKWMFIVPFIQVLALTNVVSAITVSGAYVCITLGAARYGSIIQWFQLSLFAATALLLIPQGDAPQIAMLRLAVVVVGLFLSVTLVLVTLKNVHVREILRSVIRPLVGIGVMVLTVTAIGQLVQLPLIAVLLVKVVIGLITYPSAVLMLWWISGRPDGAETYLLSKLAPSLVTGKG